MACGCAGKGVAGQPSPLFDVFDNGRVVYQAQGVNREATVRQLAQRYEGSAVRRTQSDINNGEPVVIATVVDGELVDVVPGAMT